MQDPEPITSRGSLKDGRTHALTGAPAGEVEKAKIGPGDFSGEKAKIGRKAKKGERRKIGEF